MAELMVVMVLIGLLLTIVLPRLGGVADSEQLRTAARRLSGLALEAHSQAVTQSRPWFLCLDLEQKRAYLSTVRPGPDGDAGRETDFFNLPGQIVFKDAVHPRQGTVTTNQVAFGYWPQGGSEPGEIHLYAADDDQMTIFLRPYFGRTEIKPGYLHEETK